MTTTSSITRAISMAVAFAAAGCGVAGTAVRTSGDAAADTTRAASDVAETAGHGAAHAVESTTQKAGDAIERH